MKRKYLLLLWASSVSEHGSGQHAAVANAFGFEELGGISSLAAVANAPGGARETQHIRWIFGTGNESHRDRSIFG
jgi:hypothetical protein